MSGGNTALTSSVAGLDNVAHSLDNCQPLGRVTTFMVPSMMSVDAIRLHVLVDGLLRRLSPAAASGRCCARPRGREPLAQRAAVSRQFRRQRQVGPHRRWLPATGQRPNALWEEHHKYNARRADRRILGTVTALPRLVRREGPARPPGREVAGQEAGGRRPDGVPGPREVPCSSTTWSRRKTAALPRC
jgi:hypothetical protein